MITPEQRKQAHKLLDFALDGRTAVEEDKTVEILREVHREMLERGGEVIELVFWVHGRDKVKDDLKLPWTGLHHGRGSRAVSIYNRDMEEIVTWFPGEYAEEVCEAMNNYKFPKEFTQRDDVNVFEKKRESSRGSFCEVLQELKKRLGIK